MMDYRLTNPCLLVQVRSQCLLVTTVAVIIHGCEWDKQNSKNTYNIILFVVIEIPLDKTTINLPLDLPPFSRHGLPTGPTVPRQRASHGDQDLDAELLQSVEAVDEARVLEALEAGADAVPR